MQEGLPPVAVTWEDAGAFQKRPKAKTEKTRCLLPSSDPLLSETPNGQTSPKLSSQKRKAWKSLEFLEIQEKLVIFGRNLPSGLGLRNKKYKKRVHWGTNGTKQGQACVSFP